MLRSAKWHGKKRLFGQRCECRVLRNECIANLQMQHLAVADLKSHQQLPHIDYFFATTTNCRIRRRGCIAGVRNAAGTLCQRPSTRLQHRS